MHEILRTLAPASRVLDLGCFHGSFDAAAYPLNVVRIDLDRAPHRLENFIQCSADALPFPDHSFAAVISNHSFEHFENLAACIAELARILAPGGFLYIAVPDSTTFTDRLYRWLAHGGGHVNAFSTPDALPSRITRTTGLPLAATRVLFTSLSFLNRRNLPGKPQRKLLLFANGNETVLRTLVYALKWIDRIFHTRTAIYGWAYWFGDLSSIDTSADPNVCIRCGSAQQLRARRGFPTLYRCAFCDAPNFYSPR